MTATVVQVTRGLEGEQLDTRPGVTAAEQSYDVLLTSDVLGKFVAATAVDPTTGLAVPQLNAQIEPGSFMLARRKRVVMVGPRFYRVFVTFSDDIAFDDQGENPLLRPAEISGGSVTSQVPIDTDANGDPIMNANGESPDPPITEDIHDPTFRAEWNVATIPTGLVQDYVNHVNTDEIFGAQPGQLLIPEMTWRRERETINDQLWIYWRLSTLIQFRKGIDAQTHDGTGGPGRAWWKRFPHKGFTHRPSATEDPIPILDEAGERITEPRWLDTDGTLLAEGADRVFLEFQTKPTVAFASLAIPL